MQKKSPKAALILDVVIVHLVDVHNVIRIVYAKYWVRGVPVEVVHPDGARLPGQEGQQDHQQPPRKPHPVTRDKWPATTFDWRVDLSFGVVLTRLTSSPP